MLKTVQGIILRTVKYSESSVICEVYTLELGLRSYIMGGVRQAKAKISYGLVRPMNWVEMVVYQRDEKELNRVKELKAAFVYKNIPYQLIRGSLGLFMTELVQKTIKEAEANEQLFTFLQESFELLDKLEGSLANFHLSFLSKLAVQLGFMPDFGFWEEGVSNQYFDYVEAVFCEDTPVHTYFLRPEHNNALFFFLENPLENCSELAMNTAQRKSFLDSMLTFYRYHFEHFQINSHEILHQVLS
jgi:DNA repair protein RecO (recombination protein O)